MGTGAGKSQGRTEGGGEGGIRDRDICKGGGRWWWWLWIGGWEGVRVGWGPEAEPSTDPWTCC